MPECECVFVVCVLTVCGDQHTPEACSYKVIIWLVIVMIMRSKGNLDEK